MREVKINTNGFFTILLIMTMLIPFIEIAMDFASLLDVRFVNDINSLICKAIDGIENVLCNYRVLAVMYYIYA